jgi:hypothetical protein
MNPELIDNEATIALSNFRLRTGNREDEYSTLVVMNAVCNAVNKDYGDRAIKALFELWRDLKFGDVTTQSVSGLSTVVERMLRKSTSPWNKSHATT